MKLVQPKKHLGQHFLKDENIADNVASLFENISKIDQVIEIGPGMGVLTKYLLEKHANVFAIEIDHESVQYLTQILVPKGLKLIEGDFLNNEIAQKYLTNNTALVGNYPYNISSQIVFKVLENIEKIYAFGGMFQKEVAQRLVAKEGSKTYGILSVMLNTFYDTTYEFTVDEHVFIPPPKVKSGVIRCIRKDGFTLPVSKGLYFEVIKMAFNQRRKMLRNALSKFNLPESHEFAKLRAEQLSVEDFIKLTKFIAEKQ